MQTHSAVDIATEARAQIARANLRQSVLAPQLGLSQMQLSRRLNGDVSFTAEELANLAAILDVPISSFIPAPSSDTPQSSAEGASVSSDAA